MKRLISFMCLSTVLFGTLALAAVNTPERSDQHFGVYNGAKFQADMPAETAKAAADTIYLLGGPNREDGDFELAGQANWDGWIHSDISYKSVPHWHVSTFQNPGTGNGVWCGDYYAPCHDTDPSEGYGNNWFERLDYYGTAPNPTVSTTVNVNAILNYDVEHNYDYVYLQIERLTGMDNLETYTGDSRDAEGIFVGKEVKSRTTVAVEDYVGPSLNQIHLRWEMTSDSGWCDEDCDWPTFGACTIDDIEVLFNNQVASNTDFEDGTLGDWEIVFPPQVGDFSKVWSRLYDLDLCTENATPQVAFIDDGIVVPGTGGTLGITWTYGPGGYVINLNGGLAGPPYILNNRIESPVMDWPEGYAGAIFGFTIYGHLPLDNNAFYRNFIRSSNDGGVTWTLRNDGYSWYGDYAYFRHEDFGHIYVIPGVNKVQLLLEVLQWEITSLDATPAPYFDDAYFKVYPYYGPAVSAIEYGLFQDNFPEIGIINYEDLGTNSVRIDMANNIVPRDEQRNDPGDSTVIDVIPVRTGALLNGMPQMYVCMKANPLFDSVRDPLPAGFTRTGNMINGMVEGLYTYGTSGLVTDRFNFDLPDTGFFFPGDSFHYFFRAEDNVAGDIGVTMVPRDTTGFSAFPGMDGYMPLRFSRDFVVRALPSMSPTLTPAVENQPRVLFWNDQIWYGGDDEWYSSLAQLGYLEGVDVDIFVTKGPSSGLGNGLGGRASYQQLAGYRTLLYTSGDLASDTIANGDSKTDASNDIEILSSWLDTGNKRWFATGDNLAYDLSKSGGTALGFLTGYMNVRCNYENVRPQIENQITPTVAPIAGNAVGLDFPFIAYAGCFMINSFDAITPVFDGVRIMEFLDPDGLAGAYDYAAGILSVQSNGNRVLTLPYDLQFIYDPVTKAPVDTPARTKLLSKVMLYFGEASGSPATGVTPDVVFSAKSYPNPFNPATKISYTLPRAGDVTIKIFNVQGELVRTVFSGASERDGWVEWDGTDSGGKNVASGVYFYQVKTDGHELFNKMTLLK